jgi:phosphoenolpyruvate carboxykinase (ATP)
MEKFGIKNPQASLKVHGIEQVRNAFWNLSPEELVEHTIKRDLGVLADNGAVCINTGEFTGRSPKDRFIVEDELTRDTVDWNKINMPIDGKYFYQLREKIQKYFVDKDVFVRDAIACADDDYQMSLRVINEYPWSNQFVYNMFLRPTAEQIASFDPEWVVYNAPGFLADPEVDGTRQENFAIVNFSEKQIIIGGTGYTGEIKKGIFSVLNYVLPRERDVLSMHCSANQGKGGDVAIFFGLSGTGKTTLSADPNRDLIGDDEHGWAKNGVFNFEGGCYAKTIDLTEDKEPEIYRAIRNRAILENIGFHENTREVDYTDSSITQNTRVSYPIYHIDNALMPSKGGHPTNIFFLTADAFGVLPPISRLTPAQAMYYFISGYTAKVAGTEEGVVDPQATFSACFGSPFLPLHATQYAEMLGEKMQRYQTNVWLVNTGWTGGAFGTGSRIRLRYTRYMITAALTGKLDKVKYSTHPIFGLEMPDECPDVPNDVLDPRKTWVDKEAYDKQAAKLANSFVENFKQFKDKASAEVLEAAPSVMV